MYGAKNGPRHRRCAKAISSLYLKTGRPIKNPVIPWIYPEHPWSTVHVDFAGHVHGRTYLIKVKEMKSVDTTAVIKVIREVFVIH